MAVLLLVHVPPVAGVTLAVVPTQTVVAPPATGLVGIGLMTTDDELPDTQFCALAIVNVYV